MKRRDRIIIISIILWVVLPILGLIPYLTATSLTESSAKQDMTKSMEVYVDEKGEKNFNQIDNMGFQDYNKSGVSGTLSDSVYWVKIDLPVRQSSDIGFSNSNWLMEIAKPQLDSIQYWQVDENGEILLEGKLGRKYPFQQRIYEHRNFIIPLEKYEGNSTMYLAVQTTSYLQVPISIWDSKAFLEANLRTQLINGVFYGALIIMILYNIILGVALKDKNYFYFVCAILSYTLLQSVWDGYSYQFLWPMAPAWDQIANPFFIDASALSLLVFSKRFLKIDYRYRTLNLFYWIDIVCALGAMASILILAVHVSVYIGLAISLVAIVICVCSVFVKKTFSRPEVIYMIAWQAVLSSNLLTILAGLHILKYNPIMLALAKIGIVMLVVLFSLALSERINQVEHQKSLELEKRMLLNNLHEMNKKITGERDIFLAFEYLLSDLMHITGFEKGMAVLDTQRDGNYLEVYRNNAAEMQMVQLGKEQFRELEESIKNDKIGNLYRKFYEPILGDTEVAVARTISLMNRGKRRGFIVVYSSSFKELRPIIQEMVLDYANQFAMTIDNILLLSEITKAAQIDGLTQIYNRTHFFKHAQALFEQGDKIPDLAALMLDVDYFKSVNDTYGHQTGDVVLKHIVEVVKEKLGLQGIIGRYGGEEFIIIIPGQQRDTVKQIANDIRKKIEETSVKIENGMHSVLKVTISIGIAYKNKDTKTIFALTEAADKALYQAKREGRNRVVEILE